MKDELRRAKSLLISECPAAAHVILGELRRLEKELEGKEMVTHCEECSHFDGLQEETGVCWKSGQIKRKCGYCDEGVRT